MTEVSFHTVNSARIEPLLSGPGKRLIVQFEAHGWLGEDYLGYGKAPLHEAEVVMYGLDSVDCGLDPGMVAAIFCDGRLANKASNEAYQHVLSWLRANGIDVNMKGDGWLYKA